MSSSAALAPDAYYERLADGDDHIPRGDLVYVTLVTREQVHFLYGAHSYTQPVADFAAEYRLAPDGAARRQAEIGTLMQEVQASRLASADVTRRLEGFRPHLGGDHLLLGDGRAAPTADDTDASDAGAATDAAPGTPAGIALQVHNPTEALAASQAMKRELAGMRNQVARFRAAVLSKQARLTALLAEQQHALAAQMAHYEQLLQRAAEDIWTINLYLGRNETIVQLADGEPAPAEARIALFQDVRYMDEETAALGAEAGGIDVKSMEVFDAWVADPKHLELVLPTPKGVVAFKIRRNPKEYGDQFLNGKLNEANFHTYFLFRNGQRVYRIDTDLEVGPTMLPRLTEFDDLFYGERFDWERGTRDRERLRPGSDAYMQAMERASAQQRHYLRIFLLLQGVLDRTPVMHPLPAPRINILDLRKQDDYLQFVTDAEESYQLGAGRPTFREWRRQINAALDIGSRVVGAFRSYTIGLARRDDDRKRRIHPSTAALPQDTLLHTIVRKEIGGRYSDGDALVFLYDRDEDLYRGRWEEEGPAKTRASCKVYPSDTFLLNFDAATEDDIRHYLRSRRERREYVEMFPVLHRALALKAAEREAEAPFRQLLAGEIMRAHRADRAEAEAAVPALVDWWKFKNREHRALTQDDAKALRMIVAEFAHRREREAERARAADRHDAVLAAALAAHPDALYVGHKKGTEYVVLVPENAEAVFVREETWRAGRGTAPPTCVETKRWRVVDNRRARWAPLHTSARWADWQADVRAREFLTDPEREALTAAIVPWLEARDARRAANWQRWNPEDTPPRASLPPLLRVVFQPETQRLDAWVWTGHGQTSPRVISEGYESPKSDCYTFAWTRGADGTPTLALRDQRGYEHHSDWVVEQLGRAPIEPETWLNRDSRRAAATRRAAEAARPVLFEDATRIDAFVAEAQAAVDAHARRDAIESRARRYADQVAVAVRAVRHEKAYADFLAEHNDPELWEGHRKTLPKDTVQTHVVAHAAARLLEQADDPAAVELAGRALADVFVEAEALGFTPDTDDGAQASALLAELPAFCFAALDADDEEDDVEDGMEDEFDDDEFDDDSNDAADDD